MTRTAARRCATSSTSSATDAELTETPVPDGVTVTIKLAPQTLVRHIKVEGNLSVLGLFGGDFRPIFATDIERRLQLQPGSTDRG